MSEESGERETHTGYKGRTRNSGEGNRTTPLHFGPVTQQTSDQSGKKAQISRISPRRGIPMLVVGRQKPTYRGYLQEEGVLISRISPRRGVLMLVVGRQKPTCRGKSP